MTAGVLAAFLTATVAFPCAWLEAVPTLSDPTQTAISLDLTINFLYMDADIDGDGVWDLRLTYQITRLSDSLGEETPWIEVRMVPLFVYVDRGIDGIWDEIWVNRGEGQCSDFKLYHVFGRPA